MNIAIIGAGYVGLVASSCFAASGNDVYSVDNQTNETIVQYENCMECGACRIACPKGAINWNYPNDNCGIIYKNS